MRKYNVYINVVINWYNFILVFDLLTLSAEIFENLSNNNIALSTEVKLDRNKDVSSTSRLNLNCFIPLIYFCILSQIYCQNFHN